MNHDEGREAENSDPVGTVAEEAAKLLEALQDWVEAPGHGQTANQEQTAGHEQAAGHEHAASGEPGAAECRWCPVCRAAALVRQTSPEVRDHLAAAATSLLSAGAAFLAAHASAADAQRAEDDLASPVERIDLDEDDAGWDAD